MRPICPTAAAAWRHSMRLRLRPEPARRTAPAATAPELTTTICRPAAASAAISPASARTRSRRSPLVPASTLLPIFTTARFARRSRRALWACWSSCVPAFMPGPPGSRPPARPRAPRARLGQIELAGDHDLRLLGERRAGQRELAVQRIEVGERVPGGESRDVEQVHEDGGAREVAEEARAEAVPGVRALDQPGHVGEHEAPFVVEPHHAQVRHE